MSESISDLKERKGIMGELERIPFIKVAYTFTNLLEKVKQIIEGEVVMSYIAFTLIKNKIFKKNHQVEN